MILAGIAAYRTGGEKGWGWKEIADQISDVRSGHLGGMIFFNITSLDPGWERVSRLEFPYQALPQPSPDSGPPPESPDGLTFNTGVNGAYMLNWSAPDSTAHLRGYAVFRWSDSELPLSGSEVTYAVASINRRGTPGALSPAAVPVMFSSLTKALTFGDKPD